MRCRKRKRFPFQDVTLGSHWTCCCGTSPNLQCVCCRFFGLCWISSRCRGTRRSILPEDPGCCQPHHKQKRTQSVQVASSRTDSYFCSFHDPTDADPLMLLVMLLVMFDTVHGRGDVSRRRLAYRSNHRLILFFFFFCYYCSFL